MNKLKNKVFWVLTLILTSFVLSILIIFNFQDYNREVNIIQNNLIRMGNERKIKERPEFPKDEKEDKIINDLQQRIFMDSIVYTVILDDNKNISEIVNHTPNNEDDDKIKEFANEIINSKNVKESKIGNLYFANYSYSFKDDNVLTIIDNNMTKERLGTELRNSIIILILTEFVIVVISRKLTKWIVKPAIEALDKQKTFIADASHELKTPISVIMASAEALENDYQEKWINNIKSESDRMNNLITNLLDLAKMENVVENFKVNNLSKIMKMSCLTFEGLVYEKNIKFTVDVNENIDFLCDSEQMKQLIGILLDNAIKHSEENGEIKVSLYNAKNDIILEVSNKGKEIPKEEREKIFERFYRSDESRNRDENRYGLGLAIAKGIVESHDGKISTDYKNGFTVFKIVLKKN